ncbi:MAG: response regulator [Pseudomonadota bacterium]
MPLFHRFSLPSIRSKLFVLVLASVLPIVFGYIAFVRDAGQREREHVARDAATVARALVAALDRELESAESAARVAAAWPTLDAGSLAQFHAHARELLRPEFPAHAFVLTGRNGQPLLSTRVPFGTYLPPAANLESVQKVFQRGDAVTSGLYAPGPGQAPVVSADVPVWRNGAVAYVLSAELRPRRIADLLGTQQLPPGWVAEVFDNHGLVVARNIDQTRHQGGRMNAALLAALEASPEGAVTLAGQAGEPDWYSVYSHSDQHGWTVAVTYPEDAARELLGHTLPATVAGSAALLGLSLLLAWGIGGTIARSVRQLSEPAAALGRGEPLRLVQPGIREAAVVADALRQVEGELLRYRSHLEALVADRTAELERLHARVETVYATAPVGLCFVDHDLRFVMINDYLAAMNAVPAQDHLGRTLPELLGEVGAGFEEAYRRVRDTGRPLRDIETTGAVPAAPGVMRSWLSSYYPVFGPARELVGINAVVIDITDRKRLEQQNRDNEEMFRVLFEASGDALALLAYNANYVSANPAAAALFGYDDVEEFLALTPSAASPEFQPNGRRSEEMATELMRQALDAGGAQFEWVHRRRDGSNFHADIKLTRLDIGGRGMMQVTIRDISARVAADAALRASGAQLRQRERFIRTVTDNLPALVSYWDADGKLRFANRPCLAWIGKSEQDAIGRSAEELIPPEYNARFAPYFAGVLAGAPQRFECELPPREGTLASPTGGPGGEAIHVWGSYLPDIDRDGQVRGAYKLHMNVTDLKRTEGRLVQALREAEEANRAKSEFLGNMSHEIRTPMNAIMGLARLLEEAPLGRRERSHVAHMKAASKSLLGILSDLLDYSKIEAGQLALERVPFRLDDTLRSIAILSSPAAWAKGLEPVFAVAPGVPEALLGDPLRLEQVLLNLVGNAVKFTERGEVVLAVEVAARTEQGVRLRFAVRDTGIGIAPEMRERMFEPFSQGDSSTSRKYGGAGLGLSIARRLVGLMGGELGVDSAPDAGSTFHAELEFGVAEAAAPAGRERLRVLVVDDNASAAAALRDTLAGFGWDVACAAGGVEALALLREAPRFDLAFVDADMPEPDGLAVLAYARADGAIGLPPTALLAADPEKERLAALAGDLAQGAVLGKPFTRATLRETLAELRVADLRGGAHQAPAPQAALAARLAGLRMLVVEDNPINQEVANYVLAHAGATVDLAANGRIALSMLAEPDARYDAVLMDLQMPVMNGFEASAAIRAAGWTTLPIIAMSANAMLEDRQRALAAGMDEHLAKPIDVDELVATIARITGAGQGGRRAAAEAPPAAASLPILPGIDLKTTLPRFGGSYPAFASVFRRFALTQAQAVDEIRAWLAQGDRAAAARLAHRLRGVAANLGANEVAAQALQLEEALRGADAAHLALRLADLDAAMAQVVDAMHELGPAEPGDAAVQTGEGVRTDALAGLLELLQNNNMKAMTAYEALRPALAGMLEAGEAAALQEAVGTLRFEQAAGLVRAILEAKGDS